jgi:hypothetical protein
VGYPTTACCHWSTFNLLRYSSHMIGPRLRIHWKYMRRISVIPVPYSLSPHELGLFHDTTAAATRLFG